MPTLTPPPSDLEVAESVDRVADELFTRLRRQHAGRRSAKRRRLFIGLGSFALATLLVGGGTAVAGIWKIPGSAVDTVLTEWRTEKGTGPAVLDLGTPAEGSTWLSVRFQCLGTGEYEFTLRGADTSVGMNCSVGMNSTQTSGTPTFALTGDDPELVVTADSGAKWSLDYRFVDREWTDWGTNAKGDTFGVPRDGAVPDLNAVSDMEGHLAYVYWDDMFPPTEGLPASPTQAELDAYNAKHANDVITVPAYDSDGTTIVGQWVMGGTNSGLTWTGN